MTRSLTLLAPLALLAACGPEYVAPEAPDGARAWLTQSGTSTIRLEDCNDGVDNDGDGDVDKKDSDCTRTTNYYYGRIDLGFSGQGMEGNDIHPNPHGDYWKLEIDGTTHVIFYDEDRDVKGGVVTVTIDGEKEVARIEMAEAASWYVEVVNVDGDKYDSLIFATDDGNFHLVPGPVGGDWTTLPAKGDEGGDCREIKC